MNQLEQYLQNGIPLEEAAAFFVGIKKFAAPTDPPDETGQLEGMFTVPLEQAIMIMAEVAKLEFESAYAYHTYAESVRDLSHDSLAEHFLEHAADELGHYDFLVKRMAVLGGPVHVQDIPAPHPTTDPVDIIKTLIRMEQEGIAGWRKLLGIMGENPMKVTVEDYAAKEQEHLDDLWQLLPDGCKTGLEPGQPVPPVGAPGPEMPPPAEPPAPEAPPETKQAFAEKLRPAATLVKRTAEEGVERAKGTVSRAVDKAKDAGKTYKEMTAARRAFNREMDEAHKVKDDFQRSLAAAKVQAKWHGHEHIPGVWTRSVKSTFPELLKKSHVSEDVLASMRLGAIKLAGRFDQLSALGDSAIEAIYGPETAQQFAEQRKQLLAEQIRQALGIQEPEKTSAAKSDDELKETGRQRGVASASAEKERDRHRRGERTGKVLGMLGGAAAGAAGGKKLLGGKLGLMSGAAGGAMAGHEVGKELGKEVDIKRHGWKKLEGGKTKEESFEDKVASMRKVAYYGGGTYGNWALGSMAEQGWDKAKVEALQGRMNRAGNDPAARARLEQQAVDSAKTRGTIGGALAGGLTGGAVGLSLGKHVNAPLALALAGGGALLGGGLGRWSGKRTGEEIVDRAYGGTLKTSGVHPIYSSTLEMMKRAFGGEMGGAPGGQAAMAAPSGAVPPGSAAPGPQPEGMAPPPPMPPEAPPEMPTGAPTGVTPQTQPVNYLQAEQMGQQAQAANESAYYRSQLNQAQQQNTGMQQQLADLQMQMQQVQQQADQASQSIQAATQSAVMAQDEATRQATEAAKARIGAQQLRAQILEAASQDPAALGEAAMAPPAPPGMEGAQVGPDGQPVPQGEPGAPDAGIEEPPGPEGPAGQAPTQQAAPGAVPPVGGPGNAPAGPFPGPDPTMAMPGGQQKMGAANPLALAALGAGTGGLWGAGFGLRKQHDAEGLRSRVEQLEQRPLGFRQAVALARAKHQLADAELAEMHPVAGAAKGALGGAMKGAIMLPAAAMSLEAVKEYGPDAINYLKRALGG